MPLLIAKAPMFYMAQWYYILCATIIIGGLFALYFAGENFAKYSGGISSWVLSGFLFLIGITLLYIGFSSIIEFSSGHASTLDAIIDNVDGMRQVM